MAKPIKFNNNTFLEIKVPSKHKSYAYEILCYLVGEEIEEDQKRKKVSTPCLCEIANFCLDLSLLPVWNYQCVSG